MRTRGLTPELVRVTRRIDEALKCPRCGKSTVVLSQLAAGVSRSQAPCAVSPDTHCACPAVDGEYMAGPAWRPVPEHPPTMGAPIAVTSSNVATVAYDASRQVLRVAFTNGSIYDYAGVPEAEADALVAAESVGRHLAHHIKPRFPATRMDVVTATRPNPAAPVPADSVDDIGYGFTIPPRRRARGQA